MKLDTNRWISTFFLLFLFCLALSFLNGCDGAKPKKEKTGSTKNLSPEEQEVRECFSRYKEAILNGRGEEAADCIFPVVFMWYEKVLKGAKTYDRQELEKEDLLTRLAMMMARHQVPKETLLSMKTGKEFFIYSVENGLIGKESVEKLEIATVTFRTNSNIRYAETTVSSGREKGFEFRNDGNVSDERWKIDLTSVFRETNEALQSTLARQGMLPDQFIFAAAEKATGKRPDDSIWMPLVDIDTQRDFFGLVGGAKFSETLPDQVDLVGFEVSKQNGSDGATQILASLQPLYRSKDGKTQSRGKLIGTKSSDVERAFAPPGYAVGGLRGQASGEMYGFELVFMKIKSNGKLDPNDKQTSAWIGGRKENHPYYTVLDGKGKHVSAVSGATNIGVNSFRSIKLEFE